MAKKKKGPAFKPNKEEAQQVNRDISLIVILVMEELGEQFHELASSKGFWDGETNAAEKLMLMVSELSEAMEALRHGNPESEKIPGFSSEEEEMADLMIRALDYCSARGLRIGEALAAKHNFNKNRPHRHGKEF